MSALPHSLTVPLSAADMNASLAKAAQIVTDGANVLTEMSEYYGQMLTEENRLAGYLVTGGGQDIATGATIVRALTPDELSRFQLYFAQVGDIARMWTNATPPATGIVTPWMPQFRVSAPLPPTPPVTP